MKRNGILIIAVLIAILLGLLIGRSTAPEGEKHDPSAGLVLDTESEPGCARVSVEAGSDATFLVVETYDGANTNEFAFVTKDTETRTYCGSGGPATVSASGMAVAFAADLEGDGPGIVIFNLGKTKKCQGGFCVDYYEDYPQPWPPGS